MKPTIDALDALSPDDAYRGVDEAALGFATTDEVKPLHESQGQVRAEEAIAFGTGMSHDGYNLFAFGEPGVGRHTLIEASLAKQAQDLPAPDDWCFVNNFLQAQKPEAIRLPPGSARTFAVDMEKFVVDLGIAIPAAFDSDDYRERRQSVEAETNERQETEFQVLHERAAKSGAALVRTPMGFAIAPVADGKVVEPAVFQALPEDRQESIRQNIAELEKKLEEIVRKIPGWRKDLAEKIHDLNRDVTAFAATHLIETLKQQYRLLPEIIDWLERVRSDVVDNAEQFWRAATETGAQQMPMMPVDSPYERYQVNVVVDHEGHSCAPVVTVDHPTFSRLFGRIEHRSSFGNLMTDYRMIRGGCLHEANGGFLIIDVRDLLMQPMAWESLKRCLKTRRLEIESLGEAMGYSGLTTLEPEAIPLNVKVVLIGDRMLYYMMSALDPDVGRLFKVAVDFDDSVERKPETEKLFARFIAGLVAKNRVRPMDVSGVARLIEHASRVIEDSARLSLDVGLIQDLVLEADHIAALARKKIISRVHVAQAIDGRRRRLDRVHRRSIDNLMREIQLIDTKGEAVGQINGLAVMALGDLSFGKPSRITASVRLGRGEVIDIERQVELGGPLHSKGVMILSAFLGETFGQNRPLALSASLVFEQSYGGVDGDSASAAELLVLLSALSRRPIRQGLAITGSVNQKGQIQAIGGVNEKIEGFFDICKQRGLRGRPGVLIPKANVQHLMLRADVVAAIRKGSFRIYPIERIEDGVALMMGAPAGVAGADGEFPSGSVYRLVSLRLDAFVASVGRHIFRAPNGASPDGIENQNRVEVS
ncbi:MAG: lon-related putative ATP-dependent protease [Paracoccaceae bacterium]|jgi:lon-related putative ATP-dependent protease